MRVLFRGGLRAAEVAGVVVTDAEGEGVGTADMSRLTSVACMFADLIDSIVDVLNGRMQTADLKM